MALINRGVPAPLPELVPASGMSPVCALCETAFRVGDQYVTVWPKEQPGSVVLLSMTVHRGCYGQLDQGDLARIFGALERGLVLPLRVLRGGSR